MDDGNSGGGVCDLRKSMKKRGKRSVRLSGAALARYVFNIGDASDGKRRRKPAPILEAIKDRLKA